MTPNERLLALLDGQLVPPCGADPWVVRNPSWSVSLTHEEQLKFVSVCPPRLFQRGDHVFRAGDPAEHLHILKRGHVKLCVPGPQGEECLLHVLGPGDIFGESFLTDAPCCGADAVCVSEGVIVCVISREKFLELAAQVPAAVLAFTAVLAQHTVDLQRRLRDEGRPALSRVACTLIDLARRCGTPDEDGRYRLRLELNHQEIAALAHTSRPTVTQTISQFRRLDLVAGTRGAYRVDVRGLEAFTKQRVEATDMP